MIPWLTVLTTPRRREYLAATIATLNRAGAQDFDGERIIFVDGSTVDYEPFQGWRICQLAPRPLGVRHACFRLLQSAAHAGAPFVIYTEDDVTYCKNAITAISRFVVPSQAAFVSFCDIKHSAPEPGLAIAASYDWEAADNQGGHWGNQCVLIPNRSLERLQQYESPNPTWERASDILLGMTLGDFGVFNPSLAQHTGVNSTVSPGAPLIGMGRLAASYRGDDFDALTLDLTNVVAYPANRNPAPPCSLHGGMRHSDGSICPTPL